MINYHVSSGQHRTAVRNNTLKWLKIRPYQGPAVQEQPPGVLPTGTEAELAESWFHPAGKHSSITKLKFIWGAKHSSSVKNSPEMNGSIVCSPAPDFNTVKAIYRQPDGERLRRKNHRREKTPDRE